METKNNKGNHFQKSKIDDIFALVKIDNKVQIVVGKNIVSSKKFDTYKQADEYIASKPYEILINLACVIVNMKNNESTKETTKEAEKSTQYD